LENSRARTEEALALARKLGDRAVEARSLWTLLVSLTWYNPAGAGVRRERSADRK
jgi:hypothetical protein